VRIRHSNLTLQSAPGRAGAYQLPGLDRRERPDLVRRDRRGDRRRQAARARGLGRLLCGLPRVAVGLRRYAARQPDRAQCADRGLRPARHRPRRRQDPGRLRRRHDPPLRDLQLRDRLPGGTPRTRRTPRASTWSTPTACTSPTPIHDTATSCLYVKGGSIGTVIERTRVERCGDLGIVLGFDTSPEFFDLSGEPRLLREHRRDVRNCVIATPGSPGSGSTRPATRTSCTTP
jgi:hypothetical protein